LRITVGGILVVSALGGGIYFGATNRTVRKEISERTAPFKEQLFKNFEFLRKAQFKDLRIPGFGGKAEEAKTTELVRVPPVAPAPVQTVANVPPVEPQPAAPPAAPVNTAKPAEQIQSAAQNPPASPTPQKRKRKPRRKKAAASVKRLSPKGVTQAAAPASAPKAAPAAAPAASNAGYERFVGAYVSLKLNSGNEVKGILKEITPTDYKVELPGLGDFPYQHSKVKSIELAK